MLPLATDTVVVSLPGLRRHFGISVAQAQLTLSAFVAAFGFAQLVYGPMSDRFGRRPTLAAGLAIFLIASIACVTADSIESLIIARFFQALGCCAPTVIGRAIVRDVHGAEGTARMMGYISAGVSLLICAWPVMGGQLEQLFGWRAVFALHVVVGGTLLAAIARFLPESNRHLDPGATGAGRVFGNYRVLLADRRFLGYAACNALGFSAIMAFLSSASFVLMGTLGLAAWQFSVQFALAIFGYILGTMVTARLVTRVGIDRLLRTGTALGAAAGVLMAALALSGVRTVSAIIVPYFVYMFACGLNQPSAMAGAIGPFPKMAGTASALMGFLQLACGAIAGFVVAQNFDGTPVPMAVGIALCSVGMLGSYRLIVRPSSRRN
jgi:MFS transporter, DHA1 family, multidrug resistance protein